MPVWRGRAGGHNCAAVGSDDVLRPDHVRSEVSSGTRSRLHCRHPTHQVRDALVERRHLGVVALGNRDVRGAFDFHHHGQQEPCSRLPVSGWFPKALGIVLVVASASYLVDMLAAFLIPGLDKQIHTFTSVVPAIAEPWMVVYLLVIGVKAVKPRDASSPPKWRVSRHATRRGWPGNGHRRAGQPGRGSPAGLPPFREAPNCVAVSGGGSAHCAVTRGMY